MADTISDVWVNFAKTGHPTPGEAGHPTGTVPIWQPFDKEARATMVFDSKIELQHDVDRHLRDIWYG